MTERTETMKEPVKRLAQTILVAIVFLIVYTGVLLYVEKKNYDDLIMADSYNKVEAVRGMIEGYDKTAGEIGKGFSEDENARVRLMAIRLSDQIRDGKKLEPYQSYDMITYLAMTCPGLREKEVVIDGIPQKILVAAGRQGKVPVYINGMRMMNWWELNSLSVGDVEAVVYLRGGEHYDK